MHARAAIRAAIVAALTGLPTTAARVYAGRTRPLPSDAGACLLIYAVDETSDADAMGVVLARTLTVVVEGRVIMAGAPDETLDQIALEVEPAMIVRPLLAGLAQEVTLIGTTINVQAPGEHHVGEVIMRFRVRYRTKEGSPATAV